MALEVVVLAAGMGTRMRSAIPKVLHPIAGQPMLAHVLAAAATLHPERIHVVVGSGQDQVRAVFGTAFNGAPLNWVAQLSQRGTGDAVLQALPHFAAGNRVLVLYGDVPLIAPESLAALCRGVPHADLGVMTAVMADPSGLGRILRDAGGQIRGVREERDASPAERQIQEINTGIMLAPADRLGQWLPRLKPDNTQKELYLTDIVALAVADGVAVTSSAPGQVEETGGINDRTQLAAAERIWQRRVAQRLLDTGVTLLDPLRIDVRGDLQAGPDSTIDVNVVFEGRVVLGTGVRVGAHCFIRDAVLGDNCVVEPNTFIDGARLGNHVRVGPFARLRPGTELADHVRIGNFVETKKARLGVGAKASHLAYLGDTDIGGGSNIGAGTITCNYDGISKHRTEIGKDVFVGSNATLVAPLTLEDGAFVAAGSTITSKVPAGGLAVGRGRQRNIEGWVRPDQRPGAADDDD